MPIPGQHPDLVKLGDKLALDAHGMTVGTALANGICINCHEPAGPKCYSEAGHREYRISGMCEKCFDELFAESEGNDFEEQAF